MAKGDSASLRLSFEARGRELVKQLGRSVSASQVARAHALAAKFSSTKARGECRAVIVQSFGYEPARAQKLCVRKVYPRGWGIIISRKSVRMAQGGKIRATRIGYGYKYGGRWKVVRSSFWVGGKLSIGSGSGGLTGRVTKAGVYVRDSRNGKSRRVYYTDKRGRRNNKQLPIRPVYVPGPGVALTADSRTIPGIMSRATLAHERKFVRELGKALPRGKGAAPQLGRKERKLPPRVNGRFVKASEA